MDLLEEKHCSYIFGLLYEKVYCARGRMENLTPFASAPTTFVFVLTSMPSCRSFASTDLEMRLGKGPNSRGPVSIRVIRRCVGISLVTYLDRSPCNDSVPQRARLRWRPRRRSPNASRCGPQSP